jgi:hypothetical protein
MLYLYDCPVSDSSAARALLAIATKPPEVLREVLAGQLSNKRQIEC